MLGRFSGDRGFCNRGSETVEDCIYQCCGGGALFRRWRRYLEQPLPAEVRGKHERILVLHDKFQNVSQSFGFVSVIEADASAVKRVR